MLAAIEELIFEASIEKEQDIPVLARNIFLYHYGEGEILDKVGKENQKNV
jgi:hypothetical protein